MLSLSKHWRAKAFTHRTSTELSVTPFLIAKILLIPKFWKL